jgi:hypothetical protein
MTETNTPCFDEHSRKEVLAGMVPGCHMRSAAHMPGILAPAHYMAVVVHKKAVVRTMVAGDREDMVSSTAGMVMRPVVGFVEDKVKR